MSHKPMKDEHEKRVVFMYTKWNALERLDKDETLQKKKKEKEAGKLDSKRTLKDRK